MEPITSVPQPKRLKRRLLLRRVGSSRSTRTLGIRRRCDLAAETPATHLLVVRHRDEVGVLSNVLEGLKQAEINVQNMETSCSPLRLRDPVLHVHDSSRGPAL